MYTLKFKQFCRFGYPSAASGVKWLARCCHPFAYVIGMLVLCLGISPLQAEQHRHHEAHVHGVAQLNVAIEAKNLYIEFHSPAANIVGFEHHPRTKAQKDAVNAATAQLKAAEALFLLPPKSQCRLVTADVHTDIERHAAADADSKMESAHDEHHHDEHHHNEHHHNEHHHDEDHHDEHHNTDEAHEKGHASEAHEDERHSEYQAKYQFSCEDPEALTQMEVGLFQRFPAIERIEVQQLVGTRQSAAELTATQNKLRF